MEKNKLRNTNLLLQWVIFLAINIWFVCKYFPRVGLSPVLSSLIYIAVTTSLAWVYIRKIQPHISARFARNSVICLLVFFAAIIALALIYIPPLSIQVDRWSATTYFINALFSGEYPYGVHTHVSETNFPSPFPLWHYINIPFWALGDVGWQLIFFLLVFIAAVYYYSRSWQTTLTILLLMAISPAYWWEIATRSDGLSNALLVISLILFMEHYPIRMNNRWWQIALIAGCVASTRLSAIIPMALYLFRPWLEIDWKRKIGFILIAASVVILAFLPYILWDTDTWIFFQRNPFMSQTSPGNRWLLLTMVVIAIIIAAQKQSFKRFLATTSAFMFFFMLVSQLGYAHTTGIWSLLSSPCFDVSYFTLALPYCLLSLTEENDFVERHSF